jgi:hypothetical protein
MAPSRYSRVLANYRRHRKFVVMMDERDQPANARVPAGPIRAFLMEDTPRAGSTSLWIPRGVTVEEILACCKGESAFEVKILRNL